MNEKKEIGTVYSTSNYEQFVFRPDNRPINESNVLVVMRSIQQLGQRHPISVDDNYQISDGQHRLIACQRLNIPVKYIIDDERTMSTREIAELQTAQLKWKYSDYANSFKQVNHNYELYDNFSKQYSEFKHTSILIMLCDVYERSSHLESDFKSGLLDIKNYNRAVELAEMIRGYAPFYSGYNKRGFVCAFMRIAKNPNFDNEKLMRKMPRRCRDIMDFSRTEDYIEVIQNIYNWREGKKVKFIQ